MDVMFKSEPVDMTIIDFVRLRYGRMFHLVGLAKPPD